MSTTLYMAYRSTQLHWEESQYICLGSAARSALDTTSLEEAQLCNVSLPQAFTSLMLMLSEIKYSWNLISFSAYQLQS